MSELTMDNPLASHPQLNKIAQDTIDCVLELKREFNETKTPINDDNQTLHRFCAKLEHLFKAEMKEKSSLLGRRKDYFDFFCDCLSSTKGLNDGIKFVKSTGEYKTSLGRGRAFIRFSLVHQRLADTIQQCVMNGKVVSDWYSVRSVWLHFDQKDAIITALYELNDINFDLLPKGYDLDNAWPSFSKKTVGLPYMPGNWNPPSRASSYSSLASLPIQEPFAPRERRDTTSTMSEVDLDMNEEKLTQLEETNLNLSESLIARNRDLSQLTDQLNNMQERYKLLEQENQMKEKIWSEKETDLKSEKSDLCDKLKSLESKLDELRDEAIEKEKSVTIKECKLTGELEDKDRELVFLKQSFTNTSSLSQSQLDQLQEKINTLEEKNHELLNKLENLALSRDSEASSQIDSTNKLQSVLENLKETELENALLKGNVEEMNKKFENFEERLGQSEQTLESTKLLLQERESEVENLQDLNNTAEDRLQKTLSELSEIQSKSEVLQKELVEQKESYIKLQDLVTVVNAESLNLNENVSKQETELTVLKDSLQKSQEIEKELKEKVSELTTLLEQKVTETDQLKSDLEDVKVRLTKDLANQKSDHDILVSDLQQSLSKKDNEFSCLLEEFCCRLEKENSSSQSLQDLLKSWDPYLCEKIELLDKLLTNQKVAFEETKQQKDNIQSEIVLLQQHLSDKDRQIVEQNDDIQQLKKTNDALENIGDDAKNRSEKDASLIKMKDDRITTLELDVREKLNEIANLSHTIKQKEEEISQKNTEIVEMTTSVKRTHAELQTSSQSQEERSQENIQLKAQLLSLEDSFGTEKQTNINLMSDINKLEIEIKELRIKGKTYEERLSQNENNICEKQSVIEECNKKLETVECELKIEKDNSNELTKQVTLLESEKQKHVSQCTELSQQVQSLLKQNENLQTEIHEMEKVAAKFSESENFSKEQSGLLTQKDNEITELNQKLAELQTSFDEVKTNSDKVIEETDKILHDLRAELDTWKSAVENEKEASMALRQERQSLSDEVAQLRQEKEDTCKEMESLQSVIDEKMKSSEASCEKLSMDCKAFEDQVEGLQLEIQALKFQICSQQLQHEQALGKYKEQESNISTVTDRMGEQEQLIEQLEEEMTLLKQAREEENQKQMTELSSLKAALDRREDEFQMLSSKLVQTSTDLAEEHNKTSILQHQLEVSKDFEGQLKNTIEENSTLQKENAELKSDTVQLKKKVIRLIKEKDALWQKTDSLVYEQRIHAAEKWMDDSQVMNCLGCRIEFSFTTRKHHCRLCGRIYCWNCCNNWVMTTHSNKKARVCNGCYIKQSEVDGKLDSSLVGNDSDEDGIDDTVSRGSVSGHTSLDCSGLLSEETDSLASSDIRGIATPDSASGAIEVQDRQKSPDLSEKEFSSTTDELTASPAVVSPDELLGEPEADSPEISDKEEIFHVISEEEIEKSLGTSPPPHSNDLSMSSSILITVDDLEKSHVNRDNEVWLRAGKRYAVPLAIDTVGVVLCWEFSTQPKDIGFSATYSENASIPSHEAQVLIEPCKCNSHKQTVRGELTAKKAGIYTLMFDNTYSKLTTKKLSYSLYLKKTKQ